MNHPMPPELERKLYLAGIELFNGHEYFAAHETWEDVWHMAYGIKHDFYQGLIHDALEPRETGEDVWQMADGINHASYQGLTQGAAALDHYRGPNPRGVLRLFKSYRPSFRAVPGRSMGPNFTASSRGCTTCCARS